MKFWTFIKIVAYFLFTLFFIKYVILDGIV